jgi:hypothetical protein
MPNWVKNRIIVGNCRAIEVLKEKYGTKDSEGNIGFDFQKVIPMPEELSIEFGSRNSDGLGLYLSTINPDCDYLGSPDEKVTPEEFEVAKMRCSLHPMVFDSALSKSEVESLKEKYKGDELKKVVELGKKCLENAEKYGAMNWYEWSIKNWGTKWNSSCTVFGDKTIEFDTAWDPATPVIQKISEQNPEIKMAFMYADEEIGYHTGYMLITNGHVDLSGSFPDGKEDAYKQAMDLWDCSDEYVYDPKMHTYHHVEMVM